MKHLKTSTLLTSPRFVLPVLALLIFLFASCDRKSDQLVVPKSLADENPIKEKFGNYISFADEASFQKAITGTQKFTEKDQQQYDTEHGIISMATSYRDFDDKISDFETRRDTTGFYSIQAKHQTALYWKATDEYYINSPNWEISRVINQNGVVKVGENIIKYDHNRKIILKRNDLQTLTQALTAFDNITTSEYTVIFNRKGVASTESYPGYKWLNLDGYNPQEGNVANGVTDQHQSELGGKKFYFSVWLVNIRKGGVLYAFAVLNYGGMKKEFLFWQRAKVTGIKLNGSMRIKLTSPALSPSITYFYSNYGIADRWYEKYYNDDIEGHQIFAISDKLVNHTNPLLILGLNSVPNLLPIFTDMRQDAVAPNYFFNDNYGGTNMQLNPDYHWNHIESGPGGLPNPNALTTATANVEGQLFEINF
jgi:hypothetical protein